MSTRSCPHCGHTILSVARFCGRCGQSSSPDEASAGPSSIHPVEIPKLADGFANEEETRANWRPDPEILAAAMAEPPARPARNVKTSLGMPVPTVIVADTVEHTKSTAPPPPLEVAPAIPAIPAVPTTVPDARPLEMPAGSGTLPLAQAMNLAARPAEPVAEPRLRTMLGVAMPGIAPAHEAPPPVAARAAPLGTLLGVATPGIAPSAGAPQAHDLSAVPAQGQGPQVAARSNRTLLGVVGPGKGAQPQAHGPDPLAPGVLTAAFKIPAVLPLPAAPHQEAIPDAPELKPKRGLPMAPVVGAIAVAVALGGIGLFFALKSAAPLTAQGRVDDTGKEALSIRCPSCPDGTKLTFGAASVDVKGGEAVLPLSTPLALGKNDFDIKIDRPANGRDETVRLGVPVSYRVRADLGNLNADPPSVVVKAEAVEGATIEIDGKPVALTAGKGEAVFPLGEDVLGPADESKVVDKTLPFKVTLTSPSRTEGGTLPVRVRVVPLHLDAPGAHAVLTGSGACKITGQTVVGGKLTVNGVDATLGSRGEFVAEVPCAEVGKHPVSVIAHMPGFAARKATLSVTKVASLEAEAKVWEGKPLVAADALVKPESAGKPTIVEGEIVEARTVNGLTVALLDNRRGCKTSCFVRVLYGGPETLVKSQPYKVFGIVTRTVTADGKTVPEVDAAFAEKRAK